MSRFQYLLLDTATQDVVEELPFINVSYSDVLNGEGSFNGVLPITTQTASVANKITSSNLDVSGQFCLAVLRDGVPLYEGIIWTLAPSILDHTLGVQGNHTFSYFSKRYLMHDYKPAAVAGETVVAALITSMQTFVGGDLGITFASSGSSTITMTHDWTGDKPSKYSDAILLTCDTVGADFRLRLTGNQTSGFGRVFTMYMPTAGRELTGPELDTRRNCQLVGARFQGFDRVNRMWGMNTAQDQRLIQPISDAGDITNTLLLEGTVTIDTTDAAQLAAATTTALKANVNPRVAFNVRVKGDDSEFGFAMVSVGDVVKFRASEGWLDWNQQVRITNITCDVDSEGVGYVTYELQDARSFANVAA